MPIHKVTKNKKTGYRFGKSGKTYFGKNARKKALKQMKAMYANGYHHESKFDAIFYETMAIINESTTKTEKSQIKSIKAQINDLSLSDEFFVSLPNEEKAGPFNKIRELEIIDKTCKADMEFYNSEDEEVKSMYFSLKGYAFRQYGGREDLYGGKIYKNTKIEADKKLIGMSYIRSKYLLMKSIFKKLGLHREKDGKIVYDFTDLMDKIKGFKYPMFVFDIPYKCIDYFQPCKFGFDMNTAEESGKNNTDALIVGECLIEKQKGSSKTIKLLPANEKSSIEWNSALYGKGHIENPIPEHDMKLCFLYDDGTKTFGDFVKCRFVIWPACKTKNWINEEDIKEFLSSQPSL